MAIFVMKMMDLATNREVLRDSGSSDYYTFYLIPSLHPRKLI